MDDSREKIVYGGESDVAERWIAPTIFANATEADAVMKEEVGIRPDPALLVRPRSDISTLALATLPGRPQLFGPLIPIMVVKDEEQAIDYINRHEKPLALYVFSNEKRVQEKFVKRTSSGTVAINETILFMSVESLPFGGVGQSGMGSYHGRESFDAFTHKKAVLNHSHNFLVRALEW